MYEHCANVQTLGNKLVCIRYAQGKCTILQMSTHIFQRRYLLILVHLTEIHRFLTRPTLLSGIKTNIYTLWKVKQTG